PPQAKGQQAWEKFAVPAPSPAGRPMIAIIIDDMGLDRRRSERVLQLPGPLSISFMSYAEDLVRQTTEAKARGHELMMHVPMEPLSEEVDAGPGVLSESSSESELRQRIVSDLDRFTGYVGINNHMGSKFTAFAPGMRLLMAELHRRGLLFIDSMTTEHSVGMALSRQAGVPSAARNVFLDNDADIASVKTQLTRLEDLARHQGMAVAIGHPRDATIAALAVWLPSLAEKGLVLVPVTAIVRNRSNQTVGR
ncbi:MAG TPA: divergent polysaccharide deacetylase family protein, partial [Rhodospirillaceae bacterium]|nr:divergent polysaccharide deacetylase family protein [Rhodospirillaceae bacterium]